MKQRILAGLLVLFVISGIAAAATLNVPGSYGTIQAAIDAAVSGVDEVVVADDTYYGSGNRNIDFKGKAITVRSENGPENCIIDCNGLARGFYFHTSETSASVVEGFTITNGDAYYGGAIECDGASPTISNCIITGNSSHDGGGIDCYYSSPTIINCIITDNDADGVGGAIECSYATPSIINCLIKNNDAIYDGGGIDCCNSSAIVRNCTIVDNSDGIYADSSSSPVITNSILWNNGDDLAGSATATYCCIEDGDAGTGNIDDNPMFREGPLSYLFGDYYLSQISAGQLVDSNCVDAGNNTAVALGMNVYTTCTNNFLDVGLVDIGYHYAGSGSVTQYNLTTSVIDPNYGSISPDPNAYDEFTDVILIAVPDAGFKLKEWSGTNNDASLELNNIVTMDANKAVSVEFEAKTMYQLTTQVDANGCGTISPPNSPQYEGDTILLIASADAGYQVKSWIGTNDDNSVDPNNYVTMDSDKTVTVGFVSSIVRLNVQVVDGNGTVAPTRGNYAVGTVVNLTATPDPNYRVVHWTGTNDDLSINPNNTVTMTDNKTVFVEFGPIPLYNLTATVIGGNGTVAPSTGSFYDGTIVNLTATPDSGYKVKQWTGTDDDFSTETNNTVTITANKTVSVEFELVTYNLTVTVVDVGYGPCGTVDPNGSNHFYYDGTVVALTATPDPNYEIKAWTGTDDGNSVDPNNTVTINGNDAVVTVEFMPSRPASQLVMGAIVLFDGNGVEDSNYATIQDAIDAVDFYTRTGEDDTNEPNAAVIIIADGTYTGVGNYNLDLKNNLDPNDVRNITIQSEYGPAYCIIDCNGYGRGFIFSGGEDVNNYVVDGFTITNGDAYYGGGIYCNGASPRITNCKIIDNMSGNNGGGVYCTNASPVFTNTEISGNYSGYNGGAVYCEGAEAVPEFINCLVTGNQSADIGGSFYIDQSTATIHLCTIVNNTGLDNDERDDDNNLLGPKGGICAREADVEISTCIIWNNGDDLYGGAVDEGLDTDYSCIQDDISTDGGSDNIHDNPLFTSGGLGDYYLTQIGAQSPCVNTGDQYMLVDYRRPWPTGYDLGFATTSIQNNIDFGNTDMGYHYPFYAGRPILYKLNISSSGHGTLWSTIDDISYSSAPQTFYYNPGQTVYLFAMADPNYWGYWSGTEDDTSFNTSNYVTMYSDRNASVSFELIIGDELYVPSEYSTPQAAIDAARYKDTVILEEQGSPYRTSEGYYIANSKAITITSVNPDDPCCVANTIIEQEIEPETYHNVSAFYFYNVGADTILDGITIRGFTHLAYNGIDGLEAPDPGVNGGHAYGGAIYCVSASPIIKNCIITDCDAIAGSGGNGKGGTADHPDAGDGGWPGRAYGGGMFCYYSSPTVINCTFDNCSAVGGNGGDGGKGNTDPDGMGGRGGGWYYGENSRWHDVVWPYSSQDYQRRGLVENSFYDFYTEYTGRGGAVFVGKNCSPTFTDCTFTDNRTKGGLNGICGLDGWLPEHRVDPGLRFKIDNFGGAVYCDENSTAVFTDCSFSNNTADSNRPMVDPNDEESYDNDDNIVAFGGAVAFKYNANATFDNCTFNENQACEGGAIYWADSDPLIGNCSFVDNSAAAGGALLFVGGSGKITLSDFSQNEATGNGGKGGAICSLGSNPVIADCNISGNDANGSGGGIYMSSKDIDGNDLVLDGENIFGWNSPAIYNCLLTGNSAMVNGGGISIDWDSDPNIINCTIANNMVLNTDGSGGGMYCSYGSYTTVVNSILWNNYAYNGSQIAIGTENYPADVVVSYSDVQGGSTAVYVDANCYLDWDENTNIPRPSYPNDPYPDFVTGHLGGYYLSQIDANDVNSDGFAQTEDSPCLDNGTGAPNSLPFGPYRYTTRTDNAVDTNNIDIGYHYPKSGQFTEGDINYDTRIDVHDLAIMFDGGGIDRHWLKSCSFPGWCEGCDLNQDGIVNMVDYSRLTPYYGTDDIEAPLPNRSTWSVLPTWTEQDTVTMTATTSHDNSGQPVYYYFERTPGGEPNSGWQKSSIWIDTDPCLDSSDPNITYWYKVRVIDHTLLTDPNYLDDPNYIDDPNYLKDPSHLISNPDSGNVTNWSYSAYTSVAGEGEGDADAALPPVLTAIDSSPNSIEVQSSTFDPTSSLDYTSYSFQRADNQAFDVNVALIDWQSTATAEFSGLDPNTEYWFRVRAKDENNKTTGWSAVISESTLLEGQEEDLMAPLPNPSQWDVPPYRAVSIHSMTADTASDSLTGGNDPVWYYFDCVEGNGVDSGWQLSPTYTYAPFGNPICSYKVRTRDSAPTANEGDWSTTVSTDPF